MVLLLRQWGLLLLFFASLTYAQTDSAQLASLQLSWAQQQQLPLRALPAFNGIHYTQPSPQVTGTPWLIESFVAGSIRWRGQDIPFGQLRYDLVLDRVLMLFPDTMAVTIMMMPELVPAFSLQGRLFALPEALPNPDCPPALRQGYHEVGFFSPELALLAKHKKLLELNSSSSRPKWFYDDQSSRYVYAQGSYSRFSGKSSLLRALGKDQARLAKTFLREQNLRVRKADIPELAPLFAYLSQQTPNPQP